MSNLIREPIQRTRATHKLALWLSKECGRYPHILQMPYGRILGLSWVPQSGSFLAPHSDSPGTPLDPRPCCSWGTDQPFCLVAGPTRDCQPLWRSARYPSTRGRTHDQQGATRKQTSASSTQKGLFPGLRVYSVRRKKFFSYHTEPLCPEHKGYFVRARLQRGWSLERALP